MHIDNEVYASDKGEQTDGSMTLPTVVPANSTGATGVVPFQVPEGVTSYTLILLANSNVTPPIAQASMDFQIK